MHPAILGVQQKMLIACGLEPTLDQAAWTDNAIAEELNQLSESEFNLLLFLIASHHGKVRASMQASPKDQDFPIDREFVGDGYPIRGIRDSAGCIRVHRIGGHPVGGIRRGQE